MKKTRNIMRFIGLFLATVMLVTSFSVPAFSENASESESCICTVACSDTQVSDSCPECIIHYTMCAVETYWVQESSGDWVLYDVNGNCIKYHVHSVQYFSIGQTGHLLKCHLSSYEYCPTFGPTGGQLLDEHTWGSDGRCTLCKTECEHTNYVMGLCIYCGIRETACTCTDACDAIYKNKSCAFCSQESYFYNCGVKESSDSEGPSLPDGAICRCRVKCTEGNMNESCEVCGAEGADISDCNARSLINPADGCNCEYKCNEINSECSLCSNILGYRKCFGTLCKECNFENGVCTVCGARENTLGDVDGDGSVTNADVLMIYRYIYSAELYPLDEAVADVDGDGSITNADVLAIYRNIYSPELYLLG